MSKLKKFFKSLDRLETLEGQRYLLELLREPRYRDERSIARAGYKVYSQSDEDGILQEIFRRIGTESRTFCEIGVGDGTENNSRYLLMQGWSGTWLEGSESFCEAIRARFASELDAKQLELQHAMITRDNINDLLAGCAGFPRLDLFSLDIDGNDWHVLETICDLEARVVMLEYNPKFPPPVDWVMPYDANHRWDQTDYYGASLSAWERLLTDRGYRLVGCNLTGANAFFVREDLCGDLFSKAGAAELYEPSRQWLMKALGGGHPPSERF